MLVLAPVTRQPEDDQFQIQEEMQPECYIAVPENRAKVHVLNPIIALTYFYMHKSRGCEVFLGDVYDRQTGVGEPIGARCAKYAVRELWLIYVSL